MGKVLYLGKDGDIWMQNSLYKMLLLEDLLKSSVRI